MLLNRIKKPHLITILAFIQASVLLIYLNANIVNVGESGPALPILAGYMGLSGLLFTLLVMKNKLYVRPHLFVFLLLISWIAFRVVVDLGDIYYLKQIIVGTTGGMLLFYLVGAFLSIGYQDVLMREENHWLTKLVLILFLGLLVWMTFQFSQRMRPDLFYLTGVAGAYQRAGNFLSISFIIVSFIYLLQSIHRIRIYNNRHNTWFWLSVYTISAFLAIICSQLFGSNSATAVILGVYLVTLIMSFLIRKKIFWLKFTQNKLSLPWSKQLIKRLVYMAFLGSFFFVALTVLLIIVTGFDITDTRLFGFGSGSNTSLISRIEILMAYGDDQLSYAPFLGNINVAYLTTGDSGKTLHSLFPYVIANLGLVGLSVVVVLFVAIFSQLYRQMKIKENLDSCSYQNSMLGLYSFFILLYLFLFANLATGVSWAVLWFTLGFVSKPFGFRGGA